MNINEYLQNALLQTQVADSLNSNGKTYRPDPKWMDSSGNYDPELDNKYMFQEPSDEEIARSESKRIKRDAYKAQNVYKNAVQPTKYIKEYRQEMQKQLPTKNVDAFTLSRNKKHNNAMASLYNAMESEGFGPFDRRNFFFDGNPTSDISEVSQPLDPLVKVAANSEINNASGFKRFSNMAKYVTNKATNALKLINGGRLSGLKMAVPDIVGMIGSSQEAQRQGVNPMVNWLQRMSPVPIVAPTGNGGEVYNYQSGQRYTPEY